MESSENPDISSPRNPRVKEVVKLRKRSVRDEQGRLLVEGYRELKRALTNGWKPHSLFYCPALFLGHHERELIREAQRAGAETLDCSPEAFQRMAYRERPEGLLAVGPQPRLALRDLELSPAPLVVVAEGIEKPGNLGTMLRTADATGTEAVLVADPRTDIYNPNVVRASIGTLFSLPVVQEETGAVLNWLRARRLRIVAATPHATTLYTETDLTGPTAVVMGTEQVGLSAAWMDAADVQVRIPMLGQVDSLNVAAATTLLLYEAVRQRQLT